MMTTAWIGGVLARELRTLAQELLAYEDETELWKVPPGIGNSAGTLALHLCGNLRHFVGATLGDSGYERDRPAEFERRDVPRDELLAEIEATAADVQRALAGLDERRLAEPFPLEIAGVRPDTGDFLIHLVTHLAYHLGQIDYHRRLVTGSSGTVDALSIPRLVSAVTRE